MSRRKNHDEVLRHTRNWVEQVIVKLNICPFAKPVVDAGTLLYHLDESSTMEGALHALIEQCQKLDEQSKTETTLVVYPNGFSDFLDFLDLVEIAGQLLVEQGYEGTYQLANFHPDYCFAGEEPTDPANYTNRSPYPTLHIIREASVEKALKNYPDPENIPERNIQLTRELGLNAMKAVLEACKTC